MLNFDAANVNIAVINDYAVWTDKVVQYPVNSEPFYLALGIADEWGELSMATGADLVKEAGDVCWYLARYATKVLDVPFASIVGGAVLLGSGRFFHATAQMGIICGIEKKRIRDGETWSVDKRKEKFQAGFDAACRLMHRLLDVLDDQNVKLEDCLEMNRAKLEGRLEAGTIKGDGDNR